MPAVFATGFSAPVGLAVAARVAEWASLSLSWRLRGGFEIATVSDLALIFFTEQIIVIVRANFKETASSHIALKQGAIRSFPVRRLPLGHVLVLFSHS